MKFQWDENKEKINITKHGLDFKTAAHYLKMKIELERYDEEHSLMKTDISPLGWLMG